MKTILLIGYCGSGKTWTMKNLISDLSANKKCKVGKIIFQLSENIAILGNYDGTTFEGSDKLSMSVMSDVEMLLSIQKKHNLILVCEGDRFMNSTFISKLNPLIIKIKDDGDKGREKRKSNQTIRHLKAITTRVNKINAKYEVENSTLALSLIKKIIHEKN